MDTFWELLFLAWCPPYEEDMTPGHLRQDPVRAYGQYAFREGVRLGLTLGVYGVERGEELK